MITEVRKTISGTEYWDSKEKRILFVPTGEESGFEVTVNPDSMILGMDSSIEPDKTVVNLNGMTVKQLHEYAASINVEIPADVKKKEDIIDLLS
ncbi:hypothetical protein [Bacillus pseudomycoides]|uniref:Uncharacterized protein n=1 Tax=Bacillus pseudomycoides TaxID=64104 RepID=A0A2B5HLQ0_9BACI|nr:hypothetical protein [Bacillus pseudomycoides]PEA80776.1 hypothetical protein CON99_26290 [Bacillus pseudomycoides]PED70440.1 hypothetical protein CON97_19490 [Bacillus pseudomycoides]PEI33547.1 hypothetical protein CN620_27375 [Bacillus pseudomycoides]PEJ71199.1 hypothetical protein CN680_22895 [Bacillus pseudomycoides]PEM15849.1 hypothetical protein CN628_15455 [Bacillus pseudomycoides]